MLHAFKTIEYDEPNIETYRGVKLKLDEDNSVLFNSGDFVQDWYDCIKYQVDNQISSISSSCVDHFFMDGASYDVAFLFEDEDGKWDLIYDYDHIPWNVLDGKIMFYVNEGEQLTWDQMKDKYGKEKN